jgi:NAD(P)-dependent dehydrogenase (short-subunit alcohol dehydrogenase family)
MTGTIILTGANSSLGLPAVDYLLRKYPEYHAVLTVRDTSDSDANTQLLRATTARYPKSKTSIRALDLADLGAVDAFATAIAAEVDEGKLPRIRGFICNAFYWNLKSAAQQTKDGLDKTLQVNYISHVMMVLRLLGSFDAAAGRVVLLGSDTHEAGKAPFEKIPPSIPEDLNALNAPDKATDTDKLGLGFWRYSVSKLATIMFGYTLNRHLEKAILS